MGVVCHHHHHGHILHHHNDNDENDNRENEIGENNNMGRMAITMRMMAKMNILTTKLRIMATIMRMRQQG